MATYTSQTRDFSLSLDGASYTVTGLNYNNDTPITNLVIPASYKGIAITKIGEGAFYHEDDLVTVTLPSSITVIGSNAFEGCGALTTLNMSDGIESIGENAFYDCSNLTTNDKDGLTYLGNQTEKYLAVIGRTSSALTEVTLESTTRVIGPHAFEHCTSLATVNLPSGLVGIDDKAFQSCSSLKTLSLPSSIKHIGNRIFYMTSSAALTTTDDGAMYLGSEDNKYFALVSNDFSKNATSVTVNSATKVLADYAFLGNSKLTSITLPSSITKISKELFSGCSSLTDFVMPSGVTEIGDHAFYGCSSLASISIPKDITYIGKGAFSVCQSLDAIDIDKDNQYYSSVDGVLYSKDQKTILIYPAGKMAAFTIPATVTSIAEGAFYRANLTSLTVLASMDQIDSNAFYGCNMLTSVTISANIDQIGEDAFEECTRLTSVVLPDYMEKIGDGAFFDCESLKSISLPESLQVIGENAFQNCDSLEYNEKDGLDYLGSANNKYLLLMKPVDATAITTAPIASGTTLLNYSCLANCTKLTSVSFPASTILQGVPTDAFTGCTALDSFTVDAANQTMSAIDGCITDKKQKTLRIFPMGRTGTYTIPASIAVIYGAAFTNCPNLTGLVVPTTVTYIDYGAFDGCSGLTIYAQATAQPQTWNQGWNTNFSGKVCYYSETQTTGCWHFVNNVPTAW
jgi:hypothetical protein